MENEIFIRYFFATSSANILPYTSSVSAAEINADTPKIPFLSLDTLLQRQFYNFCSPILRRNIFRSSKSMKHFNCPIYIANNTWIHNENSLHWDPLGRWFKL